MLAPQLVHRLAGELSLAPQQIISTLALFGEGNTLPFIARYRKEATGGLDEVQLRDVRDRAEYLGEMEDRRAAILKSVAEQRKLDDALKARLLAADTKQALEDLYLPFKPKRRTRAMIAQERGLGPLAELLWSGETDDAGALVAAATFAAAGSEVPAPDDALQGARDILAERVAEDAALRGWIRDVTRRRGVVRSVVMTGKEGEVSKFQDYYDFREPLVSIPSHRVLAVRRGEAEGLLVWTVEAPVEEIRMHLDREVVASRRAAQQLALVVADSYKRLLAPSIEVELRLELKTRADEEAIRIFGQNLEQLLLASPAGGCVVLGLDPGFRTGVKVALVSRTSSVVLTDTWYLHQEQQFSAALRRTMERGEVELVAIGNGTASRETETLVRRVIAEMGSRAQVVVVNESGASVYSASDLARAELPDLDVSLRGAVSIARRLQDPLAELVKIDPKSIGVGQYQHDVNQSKLKHRLDETVGVCVNRVGVEVNTASVALLSYVAGIGPTLAQNIVRLRDERGGFRARKDLLEVQRLGAKAFEQAAGFLRIRDGAHPLDCTAVHPERYGVVERMAADLQTPVPALLANEQALEQIELRRYVTEEVGIPTLQDIVAELKKPGRDPRAIFELPSFRDDITEPKHLTEGMMLDGVITNVVAFGAFVDIGVHQDGLVHVSQMSDRYITDPNQAVKVGQRVKVTVMSVDLQRNRIALSMKSSPGAATPRGPSSGAAREVHGERGGRRQAPDARTERAPSAPKAPAPKAPAPKPFQKGDVAPNGIRFR